jgi:hypothetical protein
VQHEKTAYLCADVLRALITLATVDTNKPKIFHEISFRQYVKVLRSHDKDEHVARWGSNLIYVAAVVESSRVILGSVKAVEAIVNVLHRHGSENADVALWACKAIVNLGACEANRPRLSNTYVSML